MSLDSVTFLSVQSTVAGEIGLNGQHAPPRAVGLELKSEEGSVTSLHRSTEETTVLDHRVKFANALVRL